MKIIKKGNRIHISGKINDVKQAVNYYGYTIAEAMSEFMSRTLRIQ